MRKTHEEQKKYLHDLTHTKDLTESPAKSSLAHESCLA